MQFWVVRELKDALGKVLLQMQLRLQLVGCFQGSPLVRAPQRQRLSMELQQSQQSPWFRVHFEKFARLGRLEPVGLRWVVLQVRLVQAQAHRGERAPLGRTFCPTCLLHTSVSTRGYPSKSQSQSQKHILIAELEKDFIAVRRWRRHG